MIHPMISELQQTIPLAYFWTCDDFHRGTENEVHPTGYVDKMSSESTGMSIITTARRDSFRLSMYCQVPCN